MKQLMLDWLMVMLGILAMFCAIGVIGGIAFITVTLVHYFGGNDDMAVIGVLVYGFLLLTLLLAATVVPEMREEEKRREKWNEEFDRAFGRK